jgi:outer membrane biosynthesis protein TonB
MMSQKEELAMKKVYAVFVLAVVFALSWTAYEKVNESREKDLEAKIAALEGHLKVAAQDSINTRTAAAQREEEIKKVLLILFPEGSEPIQKAFAPPQPPKKADEPKKPEKEVPK